MHWPGTATKIRTSDIISERSLLRDTTIDARDPCRRVSMVDQKEIIVDNQGLIQGFKNRGSFIET